MTTNAGHLPGLIRLQDREGDVNCCERAFALSFKWEEGPFWDKDKDKLWLFGLACNWLFCLV